MAIMDPKRRLMLGLRRKLTKVHRHFEVKNLGDGRVELTCTTCRTVTVETAGSESKGGKPLEEGSAAAVFRPSTGQERRTRPSVGTVRPASKPSVTRGTRWGARIARRSRT